MNMKANELRIGNWVFLKSKQNPYQIWHSHDIEEIADAPINFDAEPIPLTAEWLLKFGFVEKNLGKKLPQNWYELKYLSNEHEELITSWVSILINSNSLSCVICDEHPDEMGANTKRPIKYVHQLQNLYFALTGEELTIK